MRLTRRGWVAVAVVGLSVLLGWRFGARALNAVAVPALVALVVGAVVVVRADAPSVEVPPVPPGFPGETRTLAVSLSGGGLTTVEIPMPEGTAGESIDATVSPPHTFERSVELGRRGVYAVGPAILRQHDPLWLVERRVEGAVSTELVVYPRPYPVAGKNAVFGLLGADADTERQEFDHLREYVPGEPLRNIHWKSSAKRDEFLLMEFAPGERGETVALAATGVADRGDAMAEAAATVAEAALDAGFAVGLAVPAGTVPPGEGSDHRAAILRMLARTDAGSVPDSALDAADIVVRAGRETTTVRAGERTVTVEELVGGDSPPRVPEGV